MNRAARFVAVLGLFIGVFASHGASQAPASNTWTVAGHLTQARSGAAAVLLTDGRVLITGGTDSSGAPLATTEVYDPAKGTFTALLAMNVPRANHAAIVLKTGDVLVTGGLTTGGGYSDSAEIYSVSSKQWMLLQSSMGTGLAYQAMAQLADGNVLIAGGSSTSKVVGSLVLFSLADQTFMPVGMLHTPRTNAVAAATPDGRVLIAGGTDINGAVLASTEMFVYNKDTMTGSISSGPTMTFPRVGATATSTYDGVAVIGGNNGQIDLGTSEIFSQWTNTFKTVSGGTPRSHHFAALLPKNGSVLVMGGTGGTAVDLLQPWANKKAGAFVAASESLVNQDGGFASPASLGSLLAAGGKGDYASASELYWFPTISTDKPDYAPGTPVHMTGTGFQPLENVTLHIHEWVKQSIDDDPDVTVTADSLGNFTYDGYAPDTEDLGARYHLTAVGMTSGYQAQVIFTDGITFINFNNLSLDQTTNACGQLLLGVGQSGGYATIYLTDNSGTGTFYTSSASCTAGTNAITSFLPASTQTTIYYKNTATGTPKLTACNSNFDLFGICFGSASATQYERIYGPPTQVVFTTQPGGGTPGAVWAVQPVVEVQDANYNTVASNSDPIILTLSTNPGGTLSCASNPQNASSGAAAFSNCLVSGGSSSNSCYRLTATDQTLHFTVVSSCFFIENAANAGNSTVSATPNPAVDNGNTPGQNPSGGSTITVTLKDTGGALLANKAVTLTAGSGGSTINTVSGTTNSSGVATFTVSDTNPEVVTYTATDVTDNVQKTVTVTFAPGQVSAPPSTVSASPTSVSADGVTTSTVTVTLRDSSNDVIAGETVTLTQGSGSSVITPVSGTTNASGQIQFTVRDAQVENVQYTAAYSGSFGSGSFSGPNPTVRFVAAATSLTLNINPNSITLGKTPVTLTAGLSATSGGVGLGGVSISFRIGTVNTTTCTTSSTLLATVATDGTGTAPFSYITAALPTGVYRICAFTPTPTFLANNITYAASSASGSSFTLTVGQASNFVWTTTPPASAVYNTTFATAASSPSGTGHSPCNVTYGVSGGACSINNFSHAVTMTSGGGLPPGSLTCTVTANLQACQNGGITYGPATLTAVVTPVLATQATLVLNSFPANEGDGATFTVSATGGSGTGAVTFNVTGACTVSGNQVTMTATGGGQTCTVTATKASDGNYASATSASRSTISDGSAVVQITNTTQTYTGSPLPVTVTTIPAGLSYSVAYSGGTCGSVSDPNCPTLGPTLVGTYSVTAMITTSGVTGSSTANEIVSQLSPGLVLALQTGTTNPSPYGTMAYFTLTVSTSPCPTGTVQLTVDGTNVGTTQGIGCSSPLTFSTATIEPGTHNVVVQYSGDSNHAPSQSNTLSFTVSADTTSVTLTSTTTPVYVGQSITFTATVGPTSLDPSANGPLGTVQFFDGATPLGAPQALSSTSPYTATYTATLAQGSHSITATYIPGSDAEFAGSSSAIEVAVVRYITPVLTWPAPADIVYGTPLSDVQLNATATDPVNTTTVAGVFTYTPAAGTVLAVGTTTLSVSFLATDTATYGTVPVTTTVPITITGATLLVTADNQTMPYGGPIPTLTYTITGFVAGDVPSQVTGTAQCSTTTTVTSPVSGSPYTNSITCLPGSLAEPNYTFTFAPGTMTVTASTPTVSLICPEVTYDGSPHGCQGSAIGADGTSQVAGNWTYTYNGNSTAPTDQGTYAVTVTFTSSDLNNDYVTTPLTATGTLIIDIALSSVTLTCPPSVAYNGSAQTPCTASVTGSGGLNKDLTSAITYTNNTNFGTATASASYAGDTDHKASSNTVTFAISPAAVTAVAGNYTWVYNATIETLPACTVTGSYTVGLSCVFSPASVGPDVSSGPVVPVVSGGSSNFNITTVPGTYSITQASSTVTLSCPSSVVFSGLAQTPCTVTVTGVGGLNTTVPITYTNNSNVGTANASATYSGDANHAAGSASVNFAITAAPVTVTAGSGSWVYNGSAEAPSNCTVVGTYIGTLSCTNNPASVGPAVGSGTVTPVLTGDTLTNYFITSANGSWSITKATTTVTVSCPSSVVFNGGPQTPCSATVTGTGLNQALTPTYSNNTNVGTATANASYATTTNYAAATGSANFTISPALVTATAGSLTGTYNGSTQAPSACVITGAAIGVSTLTCTNSPTPVGPGVGSGTVTPVVNGSGQSNFTITPVNGTWSIAALPVQITLGNLAQIFTGSTVAPVTVSTVPTGLNGIVSVLYGTNANPTVPTSATPPSAVGSYTVTATTTNPNYSGFVSNTLVISSATSSLTLALRSGDSEPSLYGSFVHFDLSLSGSTCPTGTVQWFLNGVASGGPVTLPATCSIPLTYQTDTLVPGTYTVYAVFTSGDTNYTSGTSNTVTHVVSADTTTVNLTASGTSLNVNQAVTFTAYVVPTAPPGSGALVPNGIVDFYDGASLIGSGSLTQPIPGLYLATFTTTGLLAGSHPISATYVPGTNGTEYPGSSSTVNVTVTITKIVPSITWAIPGSIVYGTPLTVTQLNASATDPNTSATVPGSFAYNPTAGTLVHAGATNTLTATFTPTNGNVYSTNTATVNLVVTPATPTLSLTCPAATYNGNPQQTCVGSETTSISGGTTPTGTWVFNPATETEAGTYSVTGTFTSTNGDFQGGGTPTGTLTINKAVVTATAGSYNAVYDGLSHAPSACAVTGAYKGTLTCTDNPASVGPGVSSGTVTPSVSGDTLADFAITSVNGSYSITKATSTVTVTCTPSTVIYNGAAQLPCSATVTGAGGLNQPVTPVTYTNNTNAGTATASATYAGDANHAGSTGSANFTISAAPVTVTTGSYNAVYDGAAHAPAPACAVTGAFTGTLTCANNPATVGPAVGSGTVTPTVSGGTLTNFTITAVTGTWSITKATSTVTVSCPASVTYNGAAQTPCTANVTGAGGLNQTLTVNYTNNTNAGTATASAAFAGDASHTGSSNTANFTINPAAVTATAGSFSGVYNGAARTPSACAVTGAFKGSLTCTNNPASVGPAVSSGAVLPVVSGGSANFTITLVNGSWSITQASSTVTLTCPASVVYNGAAQTPCTAAVTGAGGLNQPVTPVTYTNNTNAGTAAASASFAGDANHAASTNTANFTINPAPVTATAGGYSGVYDGSTHATAPACTVTGTYKGALTCTNSLTTVGPAVGSGAVTPTVTGGSSNFAITLVNGAWSITKAPSTVALTCPASVVYNGAAQTPCTATVTGVGGLSQPLTVSYANNTNAGTATASATYAGDANHAAGSNSANFTVNPAAVTATAGSYSGAYDGASHATAPACAVTGAFTGGLTCTNTPASVGPGVGAGTVTPTVSGGTLTNFTITAVNGAWSITKATSSVTVTCPASVAYNGAAQTPCTATVTGAGGLSQSLTVSYTNNTNAGTATANASFAGDANHSASSNSANFTINPATVTATAGSYSGVYDGSTHTTLPLCALAGSYTGSLTCANSPASVGPGIGSGTVTPTVTGGSANFAITSVNGSWSITNATSTVTVTCPASVTFNGAAQTPCTATVTGVGGLNQSVTVTYSNNTNAGTATANASFAGDTNHSASSNSKTFTINPVGVTATAGSYSGTADGSAHSPSACLLTGAYTVGLTCTNNPASVGPAVGSGTVTPVVTGGSANFAITPINGSWNITQAALTPTTTTVICPASVGYNGTAQTPCTATVTGSGGLNQSLTVTYANNTNAGTATANASYAGDATYASSSNSATFTINPVAVTATAGSYSAAFDGSAHSPSACLLTGAYTVGLTCTNNPASVGPGIGSGTVSPNVTGGAANFTVTPVAGSWSITNATSSVALSCPASVGYNGAAQAPCTATVTGAGGLSQSVTVTYSNNTNAGTATANASFAGDANHSASNNSTTFNIDPAAVTATAGSYSGTADGSAHSPSACLLTGSYTVGLSCTNNPASVGPAVGSGTVTPVVTGGSANFVITPVNGSWSITQGALTPTTTTVICPASVGFNGAAQTPCTATVTGAGGLNQSLTVSYANNSNAGTATANASFAGNTTYASSSNSTNFTINPAAVTATAGSYSGTADGSAHSPSACLLTGAYTVGLTCTNNPASVGPAVGSGTVTPVVTGGTANFVITPVNGSWSITQGALTPTTTTVICPASVGYNGAAQTPCTATVTGSGGLNQSLTVTYANNTNAGTATANASFAGNTTYASSSNSATFTINPAAVTATAGSYVGIDDGSAHATAPACAVTGAYTGGLTCTNNPASVGPGTGSGTVLPVVSGGTLSNFAITAVNGSWNISLAPSTVTTVTCPASVVYSGVAQTPCTATVTGSGGFNQSLTVSYINNTNAGTATASASFAGDTNHAPSSNSANFTITQAVATVTLSNLAQYYTGSPLPVTVTTVPPGLSLQVLFSSASYPSSTTAPTNPGTYTVTATVINPNYVGQDTETLVIYPAGSGLTLQLRSGMPEPSLYGTMAYFDLGLGGTPCPTGTVQFYVDGTASGSAVTLNGSSCSSPVTFQTATLEPGSHSVYAAYSGDTLHSAGNSNTVTHAETADTTAVTLAASANSVNLGQSITFTATVTPSSLDPSANGPAGTVQFFDGSTSLGIITLSSSSPYTAVLTTSSLGAGTHSISANYVSSGGEFTGSSSSISVTVTAGKIAPTITWANPVNIVYGTALSGTQLNATATDATNGNIPVAGTFTYTPLAGTVLPVGTVNLEVSFTPTDTSTYSTQTATVTLTVTAVTPTQSLTCTEVTYDGNPHACVGTVTGAGGAAVGGSWSYTPASETAAGSYPVTGTFTSTNGNYQGGTATGTLKIDPAAVTATAGSYSGASDGSSHAPSACEVTGAYTGSLTCTNNPASVGPGVGSGTVAPSVSGGTLTNFTLTTVNGIWSITQVSSTVTTLSCPASVVYNGAAQTPCTATVTGAGGLNQSLTVSYTNNTSAGTATASASFAGDANHAASSNSASFTINAAAVTATAGSYSGVYDSLSHAPSACAVTGTYTGSLSCTNNPASVGPGVGSGTVTPSVSGGTLTNFTITAVNGAWSITLASSAVTVSCPASAVYNGAAQTPCTATVTGAGGLSQSLTVSYTNNTNVGTATASASYAGDTNHVASSNSASFTINAASQAITFTQPTSPVIYGVSPITLSATGGASGMPVVFSIDASSTGSGVISGGTLTVTGVGNLIIDANQAGNSNYLAATQVTRTIVVNLATLTVTANNASRVYGTANPAFTGSVTGAMRGDTYTESYSTVATISSNVGTYPVVPSATGANLSDYAVTVQNGILTITQAGTATSMTASSSSVTPGQGVTLTAQVASATTGTPTGSVAFYDGTSLLGTIPLTAGTATMSTSSLTPGSANTLQAVYSGDNNFTASTSSTSSVTVASLDFAVAVTGSASNTVQPGSVATYQVAVTPLYGNYPGTVSFAASGLPSGASITFSPSTIAFDGGKQTIKVTVQTPASAKLESPGIGRKLAPLTLAFLLIPLFGARKLRRQGRRLSRLACLLLLLGCTLAGVVMTGCGGAAFKQSVQNYSITVTSTSGNMQHSASVTLVVE